MIDERQNECLRDVATQASANTAWADYAAYCRDRERGLRRQAFQHLDNFLAASKSWPFDDRKDFVNWLCTRLAEYGESAGYGLIPQPITVQLVIPTLNEWADRAPSDSSPCRWLGIFFSGVTYPGLRAGLSQGTNDAYSRLRDAVNRNPNDQLARIRLVEMLIGDAEYSCHHLPDYYIGDPADDMSRVDEAAGHLAHIHDPAQKTRLQSEMDDVSQLIDDWVAFTETGESDFNQWCVDRGRTYQWKKAFYYTPRGT